MSISSVTEIDDQLKTEAYYYLNELLFLTSDDWFLIQQNNGIFYNDSRTIAGEPSFVFLNMSNYECIVIDKIERIILDEVYPIEKNLARVHALLSADNCYIDYGIYPKIIYSYLYYADLQKILVKHHTNNHILVNSAAIAVCNNFKQHLVAAIDVAKFMSKNHLMLVQKAPRNSLSNWDTFY